MALTLRLATVTLCKMGALIGKVDRTESGAKSYVKIILGWVQSIRALQPRYGETEKNWISIYDFVVTTGATQKPHGAREGGAGRRGAKSVAHTELLPQEGRTVEKRRHGT